MENSLFSNHEDERSIISSLDYINSREENDTHLSLIIDSNNKVSIDMNINKDLSEIVKEICLKYKLGDKIEEKLKSEILSQVLKISKSCKKINNKNKGKKNSVVKRLYDESMMNKKRRDKIIENYKKEEAEKELTGLTFSPTISKYSNRRYEKVFANFEDRLYYDDIQLKNKKHFSRLLNWVNSYEVCKQFVNNSSKKKKESKINTTNYKIKTENNNQNNILEKNIEEIHQSNNITNQKNLDINKNSKNNATLMSNQTFANGNEYTIKDGSSGSPCMNNIANNNNKRGDSSQTLIALNSVTIYSLGNNDKIEKTKRGSIIKNSYSQEENLYREFSKRISNLGKCDNTNNIKEDASPTYTSMYKNQISYLTNTIINNNYNSSYLSQKSRIDPTKKENLPNVALTPISILEKDTQKEIRKSRIRSQTLDENAIKSLNKLSIINLNQDSSDIFSNKNKTDYNKLNSTINNQNNNLKENSEKENPIINYDSPLNKSKCYGTSKNFTLENYNLDYIHEKGDISSIKGGFEELNVLKLDNIPERKKDNNRFENYTFNARQHQNKKCTLNSPKLKSISNNSTKATTNEIKHTKSKSFCFKLEFSNKKNANFDDIKNIQELELYTRLFKSNEMLKKNKEDHLKAIMKISCPFSPKINERSKRIISKSKDRNNLVVFDRLCYSKKNLILKRGSNSENLKIPHVKHDYDNNRNISSPKHNQTIYNKIGTSSLKFTSVDNFDLKSNSDQVFNSVSRVCRNSSNVRSRMKIREIKNENYLYNSIEKVNTDKDNLKNSVHKIFTDNFGKFKLNNFKEIFEIIYNNCTDINDFQEMEKYGISKSVKEKLVIPTCFIIKERNLEFNFQNFYLIANEIMNFIIQ